MELNFDDANISISASEILSKISEYDIFKRYCKNFSEIDVSFLSELRISDTPNCRIHIHSNNHLRYKDFKSGEYYDCWNYIMVKYQCNYYEALNIVAADFKISSIEVDINPKILLGGDIVRSILIPNIKIKSEITIIEQPWTMVDYDYWSQFGIGFDLLEEYNVFSAKYVYLTKGEKRTLLEYKKNNPCYAYRFTNDGKYNYKIYWPLGEKKFKWLFSGSTDDVEGLNQLPLFGETLVLTKSMKDCMCYNLCGIPAISLQGEANKLKPELVRDLLLRFDKIIVNYDNDEEGLKGSERMKKQYKFEYFFIDEYKDLSDYIKNKSLEEAKLMLNNKINNK